MNNKVFSYNENTDKNAYMNWRTSKHDHISNMFVVGNGFYNSAISLTKIILEDNTDRKADELVFPIVFNFNHAIEIYLKATSWILKKLLYRSEKKPFNSTHDLNKLFASYKHLIQDFEGNKINDRLITTESYINELYSVIKTPKTNRSGQIEYDENGNEILIQDITFARYALTNDLQPQFYITKNENVTLDMVNLDLIMKSIFEELRGFAYHYEALHETRMEMEQEARNNME